MASKTRANFANMPEAMRPQPVPNAPGVTCWASFAAMRQLCEATGIGAPGQVMAELLRANPATIEEAVARLVLNPDGTRWSGTPDDLPVALMELGRLLADSVHRRLFGSPLVLEVE
ncbi:hypothetical protein [Mesorhizobium sp. IMUNJ 23232]|uniref:hypothetical protein n=1 Tax=Mesorhizobium sp. IMUNJ 23232 TaxID=3376064 RepID=UPI0037BC6A25